MNVAGFGTDSEATPARLPKCAEHRYEHDAPAFQHRAQIMGKLNNTTPAARITYLNDSCL